MRKRASARLKAVLALFVSAILVVVPGAAIHAEIDLPDIGDPASKTLTLAEEQALGTEILKEIRRNLPLVEDTEITSYVRSLGLRLVASSPDAQPDFHFLVIDDGAINAFATPGGVVAVNAGLILAARNEAEVAAVVSHEIAHVTQRHLARMYAGSDKVDIATGLGILAAILVSAYSSELAEAAFYSSIAASAQRQLNFSRANEQEADRIGIVTLANAGFDPHAMPDFFERMQRLSFTSPDAIPEYLSTHPVTTSRISDSISRADQYTGRYASSSEEFTLIQARTRGLTDDPTTLIRSFEETPVPARTRTVRYTQAIALNRAGRHQEALALAQQLVAERPDTLPFQLLMTEAQLAANKPAAALEMIQPLDAIYPRYTPVTTLMARALIATGRPGDARRKVEGLIGTETDNPNLLKLRAEAASREGLMALSHESMADYYLAHGQVSTALQQLDLALQDPQIDETTEARIAAKRRALNPGK
jgi:predicted Zn-dependent protease